MSTAVYFLTATRDLICGFGQRRIWSSVDRKRVIMDQSQILQLMMQYCKENMLFESMKALEDETSVSLLSGPAVSLPSSGLSNCATTT